MPIIYDPLTLLLKKFAVLTTYIVSLPNKCFCHNYSLDWCFVSIKSRKKYQHLKRRYGEYVDAVYNIYPHGPALFASDDYDSESQLTEVRAVPVQHDEDKSN